MSTALPAALDRILRRGRPAGAADDELAPDDDPRPRGHEPAGRREQDAGAGDRTGRAPAVRARLARVARLAPPVDVDGPRVRLGLAWAAVTVVAVAAGPVATSVVFAGVALGAGGQSARSWRRSTRRPFRPVAAFGAAVCALAGGAGPAAVGAAAAFVAVTAVTAELLRFDRRDWDARLTIAIGVLVGVGAAAPAVMRDELGLVATLVFVLSVHAVDASIFIVGSGASSRWEGPVAGAAAAGVVGLASAALLVPPFRGPSPWVLAAIVAVLAPAGTYLATVLVGRDEAPVPALRRLDAYLVAGPVWALAGRLLLDV